MSPPNGHIQQIKNNYDNMIANFMQSESHLDKAERCIENLLARQQDLIDSTDNVEPLIGSTPPQQTGTLAEHT